MNISTSADPVTLPLPPGRSDGLTRAQAEPLYNFERINDTWSVTVKQPAIVPADTPVTFAGWAVDNTVGSLASGVDVVIDGRTYSADYGVVRDDVAAYLKTTGYRDSGFRLLVPAGSLHKGHHQSAIRIISKDGKTYQESAPVLFDVR
jgi:hypothetical protein